MQCVTDLAKLRDSIVSRVRQLRHIANPIPTSPSAADRIALAFVAIELDNLIITGLRQYTKSSLLRSRTAAGARITATVKPGSTEEAAAFIYKSLNPKGYARTKPTIIPEKSETVFRNPKDAETVLSDYAASNLSNLQLALSLNAEVFSEVKVFRHFFSHRAMNTSQSVKVLANNIAIFGADSPEQIMLRGRPGTGVRLVDGWLADVENFFDLAS